MRWLSRDTIEHLGQLGEWPDLADTKYEVREVLGRGGMGTVYLVEDTVLLRTLALKVASVADSDPETARRMLREARIVARLEHPGIVPIHDVGTLPDGRVFYAMKLVKGRRLDELTAAPLAERLRIFQRICDAVAFAHAHGVVHRDLKPENVMVGAFGEVLVMDWGVAKIIEGEDAATSAVLDSLTSRPAATAHGTVVGTPAYMAPEQADGRSNEVNRSTDIYALGGVLYFLLTTRPPFEGDAAAGRVRGGTQAQPVAPRRWVPDLPRPLEAIVFKAMGLTPADRYGTVEELAADTVRFLDRARVLAYRESPLEHIARLFGRFRTPILLVLAYLIMRAALIFYARR